MTKFASTPVTQESTDFTASIRSIERTDKEGRILGADLFHLGELLYREGVFNVVQIFNWLAMNEIKMHKRGQNQYVELVLCRRHGKIIQAMKQVFLTNSFAFWALKHFNAQGIFATYKGQTLWQYPPYSRRDVNPMDVVVLIQDSAHDLKKQ